MMKISVVFRTKQACILYKFIETKEKTLFILQGTVDQEQILSVNFHVKDMHVFLFFFIFMSSDYGLNYCKWIILKYLLL